MKQTMWLFEAVNGWTGESYIRCYVWAENDERALELAREAFKKEAITNYDANEDFWRNVRIYYRFDNASPEFVTIPSGSGWKL